jgi:hypothetical protein
MCRGASGATEFQLDDLHQLGLVPAKGKVLVNCLVKLGHVQPHTASGTYVFKDVLPV